MAETLRGLPKFDPVRTETAMQIRTARNLDVSQAYITDRKLTDYVDTFQGLTAFFEYVRSLDNNPMILDIGAGSTLALSDINLRGLDKGLTCKATVLTHPQFETTVKKESILHTSVEMLSGVPDTSVSGILSCYGISYAHSPRHAIRRIHEVLRDGGALKATFPVLGDHQLGNKTAMHFTDELQALGYDIAMAEYKAGEIVVAIKPGNNKTSAISLLWDDAFSMEPSEMINIPVKST